MGRLSLWKTGTKTNDFRFIDKTICEYYKISGTSAHIYKYIGIDDGKPSDVMKLQDFLFLENRDRKYDTNIFELYTIYEVQEESSDLKQFDWFLGFDGINITFHLSSVVDLLGRKLMVGDVIELPHLRDTDLLDGVSAYNKFYVVKGISKPSSGFSSTWFPHILQASVEPMTDSQETRDIMERKSFDSYRLEENSTLKQLMSTEAKLLQTNDEVIKEADTHVPLTNYETMQFYLVDGDEGNQFPWIFAGDGIPPNNAKLIGSGKQFPEKSKVGDYFLRIDFDPPTLFKKEKSRWKRTEINYRRQTGIAHRVIESFIFNDNKTTLQDGSVIDEKTMLSQALKNKEK